jgi:hypothetical protein
MADMALASMEKVIFQQQQEQQERYRQPRLAAWGCRV